MMNLLTEPRPVGRTPNVKVTFQLCATVPISGKKSEFKQDVLSIRHATVRLHAGHNYFVDRREAFTIAIVSDVAVERIRELRIHESRANYFFRFFLVAPVLPVVLLRVRAPFVTLVAFVVFFFFSYRGW